MFTLLANFAGIRLRVEVQKITSGLMWWQEQWLGYRLQVEVYRQNVKLSLCLIKYRAMKTYWGNAHIAPRILNSALYGGERSVSRPGCCTSGIRAPSTHLIGGWLSPRDVLDGVVERKNPIIATAGS
jgi:hypothetical protein